MQAAVRRPHFAAGVALVGASVIAAAAVTPMPEIHLPDVSLPSIHAAEVDLAALANPLEVYAQVFQTALANTNTLIQNTVPGQLLNQILQNQVSSAATLLNGLSTTGGGIAAAVTQVPAALTTAVTQLAAGNVEGAVNTLLGVPLNVIAPATGLLPVLQTVLTQPLTNLVNVVNAFTRDPQLTLLAVSGFIAPLISAPAAAAAAVQNVINAVGTGDLGAVANAVFTAPATIADGILNGGYGPNLGPLAGFPDGSGLVVKAGGLLSSSEITVDASGNLVVTTGGPLYSLQQVLKMITQAIKPPAPTATIASLPTAAAATITLGTAPAASADKTTDTTTPAASAPATSADKPAVTDKTASTPASTKDGSESTSAPTDSTTNTPSKTETDTSTKTPAETPEKTSSPTKPTSSAPDVKTGNKVEPGTTAGADAPKSNGSNTSTTEKDGTPAAGSTSATAGGAEKGAGAASGSESKGAAKGSAA
ncbi:hypothetical protein [Mycobacterium sp. AT1]|uniref:hypothetical protein n=1 Tax=Mycobacterium sp. AT1 TaxID=1961706 RepID=UPI0009AE0964|nr:hypothetical protein [Mycobacterium sp. AT1]OPX11359.1 hypothetical protein B1790_08500 [Mycobacterium sp. AT1]